MSRSCAITGANGYLGSILSDFFRDHGWSVCPLARQMPIGVRGNAASLPFSLEKGVDAGCLKGVDTLIHCAYDSRQVRWEDIVAVNVKGSLRLFEIARRAGVKRIIFISSISAFENCRSLYGKAKLAVEKEAERFGAISVRPGLIYGPAMRGMCGALRKVASASKLVPLVGNGRQVLYLGHEEDVSRLVLHLCSGGCSIREPIVVACEKGKTFRQILKVLASVDGKSPIFIPVPWRVIWGPLKGAELVGLQLPFRSDSVVSLVSQDPSPSFAVVKRVGIQFREFTPEALVRSN